ncbi:MAG: UDP-N-acetylmuramyl-tripeptide synthetase [Bacillales bacterium]|jgi:UDP-N-acetylmuramoyl-L-alanyl-D-glutamate--2,6-diaminopimelate ligase|nr:UDP-N-acetylmuramyl-tripeptide synthetase [Bacillales bacterium]
MKLIDLVKHLKTFQLPIVDDIEIKSIEMDSRQVKEGSLFICIEGFTVDGHNYVEQAINAGAVAIVAEKKITANVPVIYVNNSIRAMAILADAFFGHPTKNLKLIGVTGTNGKTTTTQILSQIFEYYKKTVGSIGTLHIKIGEEIEEVKNTTPDSLTLQKTFKKMNDYNVEAAFIEVSSHALHLGRVHGCDFDIAVFTNLTQDHLDYHQTMENYKNAKGLLFAQLGNTYNIDSPKYSVLNNDDPASNDFAMMTASHIITYGIDNKSDVMAKNIELTNNGTRFELVTPIGSANVSIKLIGKFNVYNILAAVSVSLVYGLSLTQIIEAISDVKGVRGRFEVVEGSQDFTVVVDYSHTPDSLENVIVTLNQLSTNKLTVIVGCGGNRDKTKRPIMGEIATRLATQVIFTSDNPRNEEPEEIIKDILDGVSNGNYSVEIDRRLAIRKAIQNAEKNDIILIAGKGHETYQIIKDEVIQFDDVTEAINAIKDLNKSN